MTGWRTVKGIMHITLEVPFTVLIDEEAPSDPDLLVDYFNDPNNPDALEAADIQEVNGWVHEVYTSEVHAAHVVDDA